MDRQVPHILESADLLGLVILPDLEVLATQIQNRSPTRAADRGIELDELDIEILEVLRRVDEHHVLGGASIHEIPHSSQVGQSLSLQEHGLQKGRLIQSGHSLLIQKELYPVQLLAVRHLDLDHRAQALLVVTVLPWFDESQPEALPPWLMTISSLATSVPSPSYASTRRR